MPPLLFFDAANSVLVSSLDGLMTGVQLLWNVPGWCVRAVF